MSLFARFKKRLSILFHSKNIRELVGNLTPFTLEFVAAIIIFLYVIIPIIYIPEGIIDWFSMGIGIFLNYISYLIDLSAMRPSITLLWILMLVLMVMCQIRDRVRPGRLVRENPVYVLFACFIIWMLVSTIVTGPTDMTLYGNDYRHEGVVTYCGYVLVLFFTASLIYDERIKRFLCDLFLAGGVGTGIFALCKYYFMEAYPGEMEPYPTAFFFQFNHYGYYLAMNIMLAAAMLTITKSRVRSICYTVAFAFNIVVLNFNNTFGAWLACACGFIFMLIARAVIDRKFDPKPLIPMAVFVAITGIMSAAGHGLMSDLMQFTKDIEKVATDAPDAGNAGTTRWMLWTTTVGYIRKKPLFGWGVEGTEKMLEAATGSTRVHNEYLYYAVSFGIPASILYTLSCIGVFIRNIRRRKSLGFMSYACLTAAFTYMVSAFFGNSMYNSAPFFFILLGLGYRSVREDY